LAIRSAYQGEIFLSPAVSQVLVSDLIAGQSATQESGYDRLTAREREVLQLVAEGNTNSAIASMIHVSVKTVEKHRANLMAKLEVRDVAGLTRLAIKHRLVFIDD
jgi:DNA-binding NarL/FixJ family response regulator